jgi:hypothetical protein
VFSGRHVHRAEEFEGGNGGERIQAAIIAADAAPGHNVVVVGSRGPDADGRWVLTQTLELPSHTTLILVGAYLFLADRANDNLIRNRDFIGGNRDIHIIGVGGARLDGNPGNQDRGVQGRDVEIWMERQGMPLSRSTREAIGDLTVAEFEAKRAVEGDSQHEGIRKIQNVKAGLAIRFYNVDDLSIRGLTLGPTSYFVVEVERVTNFHFSDITLAQDGYEPNQAGIKIIGPAERIVVSDFVGTCGDDAIHIDTWTPLFMPPDHHTLSAEVRRAEVGPVTGVTINNVVMRNRWCTGLLRTSAADGHPIDGVHASNLQLLESGGYSEGHAVLKFGNSRPGEFSLHYQSDPAAQSNITVENVFAQHWRGPYCAVFSPVKNLTIRGARGSHTGPFFHNFGQAMDGLVLEDCRTTLIGGPEEPFVTGMIQYSIEVQSLSGTLLRGTPAAVVLDGGPLRDIEMRNVSLRSALKPGDRVAGTGIAGLRLAGDARVDSLRASGLIIEGYETGVVIEDGVRGEALQLEGVTMLGVATPWVVPYTDWLAGDSTLNLSLV